MAASEVKYQKVRSRRETESEVGVKFAVIDPKPGDLSMSRLKVSFTLLSTCSWIGHSVSGL